jgi:hypothetical protein
VALQAVDKVTRKTRRERHWQWGFIAFDIIVTLVLSLGLNANHNQQGQISREQQFQQQEQMSASRVQLQQCQVSNAARAFDKKSGDALASFDLFLLNDLTPPGTKVTPKIAAEIRALRTQINRSFSLIAQKDALRDCTRLFG